ncbi:MAG: hypothetical protein FWD69_12275 [Polyangiaceae bacterium]|nr:hypothetical protein [Polyangiaceae bacterium]
MRVRATYLSTVALTTAIVFACSSNTQQDVSHGGDDGNATTIFSIAGADFTGNSVRICGSRPAPDPKYRCDWSLTPTVDAGEDAGTACPCFNFTADGNLADDAGAPVVVTGLCPSIDFPPADWSFQYQIFSAPDCAGTQLNDGTHNFTCYDSRDIATRVNPNLTVEALNSGLNTNHILCNTDNASKDFNFGSCASTTTAADTVMGNVRYDCGCILVEGTCSCGTGGITASDLEAGCLFDPTTCEITCPGPIPPNMGVPMVSMSILMDGPSVLAYVPHGQWEGIGTEETGVGVVSVEGTPITPVHISTPNPVNSCSSNSITGTTVCTANGTDVYLISGTTLTGTLTSGGTGEIAMFEGTCTTCGVVVDSVHNRAVLGVSIGGGGAGPAGFQILNLNTLTLRTPFLSQNIAQVISDGWSVDPIRNLILSANTLKNYEIIHIANPTVPAFFENYDFAGTSGLLSASVDVSTGITFAPGSDSYIADLSQATLIPGSPGTWDAPHQYQEGFPEGDPPNSGDPRMIAIAQGTHIGIVNGFGDDGSNIILAAQLPSTGGTGTPALVDWVSCSIGANEGSPKMGNLPFTTTAYTSPNTGHAMGVVGDENGNNLTLVDLTEMLDPTIVPRTSGPGLGHACVAGTLPASVLRTVSVP